jgi:hypothetical protein
VVRAAPDYEAEVDEGQGGDVMWKELDRVTRLERLRDLAKQIGDQEKFAKLDAEIKDIYSKPTTEEANPGVTPADIDGTAEETLGRRWLQHDRSRYLLSTTWYDGVWHGRKCVARTVWA